MNIVPPVRVSRSYVQKLHAPPGRVFPLLCPVREAEWVEGWDPLLVVSESGVAEQDCIFVMPDPEAIWVVTAYDPPRTIEFIKVTPGVTVARIGIALESARGSGTDATVTYSHTALSAEGETLVNGYTDLHYRGFMEEWETALNDYLGRTA